MTDYVFKMVNSYLGTKGISLGGPAQPGTTSQGDKKEPPQKTEEPKDTQNKPTATPSPANDEAKGGQ